MSTWTCPVVKPGRVPKIEGYYAICSGCSWLEFYTMVDGAEVAVNGHKCKVPPPEKTKCNCKPILAGCTRKAEHR